MITNSLKFKDSYRESQPKKESNKIKLLTNSTVSEAWMRNLPTQSTKFSKLVMEEKTQMLTKERENNLKKFYFNF